MNDVLHDQRLRAGITDDRMFLDYSPRPERVIRTEHYFIVLPTSPATQDFENDCIDLVPFLYPQQSGWTKQYYGWHDRTRTVIVGKTIERKKSEWSTA